MYKTRSAISWAIYDLANTIYSAAVVTVFLPLYLNSLTHLNVLMGAAATIAMILAGVFAPPLGAITDTTGRTKHYLIITTIICCISVFFIAMPMPLLGVLGLFIIAHFFYHLSLIYYNSLLTVVAPPDHQGWVSGLGVGLGYAGILVALPIGYLVEKFMGTRFVFPAVSLAFLAGTIPLILYVPERTVDNPQKFRWGLVFQSIAEVTRTALSLPRYPKIFFFLVGNFFIQEAVNAMILWLSVFIKFSFQLTQGQLILVLLTANVLACFWGFLVGYLTDKIGSMRMTWVSALSLFLTLFFLLVARNPYLALGALLILGSLGLAGIWVAERRLIIELSPPEKIGEFFGLFGMTSKLACFSMTIFAILSDRLGFRAAILELLIMLAIGLAFLAFVRAKR